MPREFEPFAFERTAAPQPGLPPQKIMIIRHGDGSLHIGLRVNGRTSTVMMDPDSAAAIRAWMLNLDGYDQPTHAERLAGLHEWLVEWEREHGPIDPEAMEEARRVWPQSMGMGKDGPADLSQREGFGD